jgi:hypothetical protein
MYVSTRGVAKHVSSRRQCRPTRWCHAYNPPMARRVVLQRRRSSTDERLQVGMRRLRPRHQWSTSSEPSGDVEAAGARHETCLDRVSAPSSDQCPANSLTSERHGRNPTSRQRHEQLESVDRSDGNAVTLVSTRPVLRVAAGREPTAFRPRTIGSRRHQPFSSPDRPS